MSVALVTSIWIVLQSIPDTFTDSALLQSAEDSFHAGIEAGADADAAHRHFALSATNYAELRHRGYDNADLMQNEGNASLSSGNLPQALWAYRHGLDLAPGDNDLRALLDIARAQVAYSDTAIGRPPSDAWHAWVPRPSAGILVWVAFGAYVVTAFAVTHWLMVRRSAYIALAAVTALGALAALGGLYADIMRAEEIREHPLVVVARDGVLLRRGNGLSYPPRVDRPLNRGVEARRLFERGTWYQVRLATGEVGWLERSDFVDGTEP